ncbi:Gfo/Idh/MocA family protein [Sphingomonas sp. CCH9-E2]|uniref:Gfo/Idh/MocA family protein n=3 Tax=unclassified Sphingomonas TaxID=196159 RepID=UPI000834DC85|nr:Gfo/Idh/MocA family oxidoreductase [Sphingomonas sp. CCH9-E2]
MIRVAIIGFGKIAADQHLPAIAADPRFELVAVATPADDPGIGVPWYADAAELLTAMGGAADAIAICTPPSARHDLARDALCAGFDVLLEKPPTTTLGELDALNALAQEGGRVLYTAWHSQFAPGVAPAAALLADAVIETLDVSWREDVRKWHPGQEWIWNAGGFGVFDTGINALSILSQIAPMPLLVRAATLSVPENRQAPIAASIDFIGGDWRAEFDWRFDAGEEWIIRIGTQDGRAIELRDGGARLIVDGADQPLDDLGEYPQIYDRFATLIDARACAIDREPLRIAADAFMVARRESVAAFP